MPRNQISVVGLSGGEPVGKSALRALENADLVVGGLRHLDFLRPTCRSLAIKGDLLEILDEIDSESGSVCVVSSGDPGFFGMVRSLAERFGPTRLDVYPAPSSVSLAFARLGLAWDDAVVVSAHGRSLEDGVAILANVQKGAVFTSPTNPPEAIGKALIDLIHGRMHSRDFPKAVVCSRLDEPDESITYCTLDELAQGPWDPLSVVIILGEQLVSPTSVLAWGLPTERFAYRDGMITKSEVRAVALGKLELPTSGVLWDVGAGSGSVAIECAALCPGLRVIAIERCAEDASRIELNASAHGVNVEVVLGEAPGALEGIADPDRVFVGGGGIEVLDAVVGRLKPGGRVVATYASVDRALLAYRRLGSMVEVGVSKAESIGDGVRLVANNPVLIAWGPSGPEGTQTP